MSKKGCDKAKTLSQNGCEKAKTLTEILFSTPQISESIPFLFSPSSSPSPPSRITQGQFLLLLFFLGKSRKRKYRPSFRIFREVACRTLRFASYRKNTFVAIFLFIFWKRMILTSGTKFEIALNYFEFCYLVGKKGGHKSVRKIPK